MLLLLVFILANWSQEIGCYENTIISPTTKDLEKKIKDLEAENISIRKKLEEL
jgi:hypothetical protein